MKAYTLQIECPEGAILVGGHHAAGAGESAVHAMDANGRPVLPATAVRGALRQSLEAWLRGLGKDALGLEEAVCHGGVDDMQAPSDSAHRSCSRCVVCKIFGGAGEDLPANGARFSLLVIEDATLVGQGGRGAWQLRSGNAVDRARRSVQGNLLYTRRVAQLPPGARFEARVWLDDPLQGVKWPALDGRTLLPADLLAGAARATSHLGSGRSRGLGHVQMQLEPSTDEGSRSDTSASPGLSGQVRLLFHLESQACLGSPVTRNNLTDTRTELPGATVRGLVGFALAKTLADADPDRLARITDPDHGARFDFAWPVDNAAAVGLAGPLPLTSLTCKQHGRAHGLADDLVPRLRFEHAEHDADFEALGASPRCAHSDCGAPLGPARGHRRRTKPAEKRALTRTALDRSRDSVKEHALFTQALLQPGLAFEGSVRGLEPGDVERIVEALRGGLATVGKGRSRGWGRVKVEVRAPTKVTALGDRVRTFVEAVQRAAGDVVWRHQLVVLTALSPIVPERGRCAADARLDVPTDEMPGDHEVKDAMQSALNAEVEHVLSVRRYAIDGVWVQREATDQDREDRRMQVAVAGSVFVLRLPKGHRNTDEAVVKALASLEEAGVGARRTQGFGRVLAFDPLHSA